MQDATSKFSGKSGVFFNLIQSPNKRCAFTTLSGNFDTLSSTLHLLNQPSIDTGRTVFSITTFLISSRCDFQNGDAAGLSITDPRYGTPLPVIESSPVAVSNAHFTPLGLPSLSGNSPCVGSAATLLCFWTAFSVFADVIVFAANTG